MRKKRNKKKFQNGWERSISIPPDEVLNRWHKAIESLDSIRIEFEPGIKEQINYNDEAYFYKIKNDKTGKEVFLYFNKKGNTGTLTWIDLKTLRVKILKTKT